MEYKSRGVIRKSEKHKSYPKKCSNFYQNPVSLFDNLCNKQTLCWFVSQPKMLITKSTKQRIKGTNMQETDKAT
jgi:hypothetical protein